MAEPALHARDGFDLQSSEAVEQAFIDALAHDRLHHAWLLTGPEGIGKAAFAYRAARRLLGAAPSPADGLLASDPQDKVSRLVATRAHPDLVVLERAEDGDRLKRNISVDEARTLPAFFAMAPSMARFRVAIIDAVDDMNNNAANALLKTLEEPPERGVLFLVSHAPGRLLPTIRSRCRRLSFRPWPDAEVAAFVRARTDLPEEDALALAKMARGAPGRALRLAESGALQQQAIAQALVTEPWPAHARLLEWADGFRGARGGEVFAQFLDRLADAIRDRASGQVVAGGMKERWADLWDSVANGPSRAEALNLDRADMFWTLLGELKRIRATS